MNSNRSVPGILGTRLEAKLDRDWVPHYICSKQADWFTIWMNYEIIAPLGGTCWADNLKLHYTETTGRNKNTEGVELRPECYGSTDCIEWLDPHHLIPAGRYFHDIIQSFVREGYTVDYNLKAATYDWRYSPSELHEIGTGCYFCHIGLAWMKHMAIALYILRMTQKKAFLMD